jgi:hypothetical protein
MSIPTPSAEGGNFAGFLRPRSFDDLMTDDRTGGS